MARHGPSLEVKQEWMRERQSTAEPPSPDLAHSDTVIAFQRHYRPKDLAELWGLDESTVPTVYLMSDQWGYNFMTVIMRTAQQPAAVASAAVATVQAMDGQLPVYNIKTMEDIVSASVEEQRFQMLLLGTFSGLALFLAIVGTYTVVSSNVNERTLEFGIRTALGAQPRDTLRLVVYHGARLAGIGVIVGVAGVFLTNRVLGPFLFETSPMDPAALLGAPLFLIAAATVATIVPARRAVRVDPMTTMRAE